MEATTPIVEKAEKAEKESKWYVLRVVSGKERKIKEYLDKDIVRNGWTNIVKQVFLPVEKVYKVLNGKKVMRERNFYPGYIMIEVADGKLNDDMIQSMSNISNVMHFLTDGKGSKGNIISLRKAEVNKMLGKVDEMSDIGGMTMSEPFIIGETIKIIDGPFNDFNGVIEEVNDEKEKTKGPGKDIRKGYTCGTELYAGGKNCLNAKAAVVAFLNNKNNIMKKLLTFIPALLFVIMVTAQPPEGPAKKGMTFGAKISADGAIGASELATKLNATGATEVKVKGKVVEVCKAEGCWLRMETADGSMLIKMKDHAYFVPLSMNGKTIVAEGSATIKETSVEMLRHYAEDAGRSKEEIGAIKEPKKEITMQAKGILVL